MLIKSKYIDLTGKTYIHPIYGGYIVLSDEGSYSKSNRTHRYKIRFIETGYEYVAPSSSIKNQRVRDRWYVPDNLKGKVFTNNCGQKYKVIRNDDTKHGYYIIEFLETGARYSRYVSSILKCEVYDNKGLMKTTVYDIEKGKRVQRRSYATYMHMFDREKLYGTDICEEWRKSFNNFLDWLENTELPKHNVTLIDFDLGKALKGYELDKDWLSTDGKKIYSPTTCRLMPEDFNMSLRNLDNLDIVLCKDGKEIEIKGSIRPFLQSLGYEISPA